MTPDKLKKAIKAKFMELEIAMSLKKPYQERLKIHKEVKDLQYSCSLCQIGVKVLPGNLHLYSF